MEQIEKYKSRNNTERECDHDYDNDDNKNNNFYRMAYKHSMSDNIPV